MQRSDTAGLPVSHPLPARQVRFGGAGPATAEIEVAVEAPVAIAYGGMPYAVMMATPADLEDFVTGFSLTEGIVRGVDEIRAVAVRPRPDGIEVDVSLSAGRFREHLARRRNLSGRTACGLCGVESLDEIPQAQARAAAAPVTPEAVRAGLAALEDQQPLGRLTRSVHAAAWCDGAGTIVAVREDVGRHNALDKLIGARLRSGDDSRDGFVLITSRASFEMVEKAAIFGAGTLVAISAPTSLAIERAECLGLSLLCVARRDGFILFAGALADDRKAPAA